MLLVRQDSTRAVPVPNYRSPSITRLARKSRGSSRLVQYEREVDAVPMHYKVFTSPAQYRSSTNAVLVQRRTCNSTSTLQHELGIGRTDCGSSSLGVLGCLQNFWGVGCLGLPGGLARRKEPETDLIEENAAR